MTAPARPIRIVINASIAVVERRDSTIRLGCDIATSKVRSGVKRKQTTRLLGYNKPPEFHLYSSSGPFSHTPDGVNKDKMKLLTSYLA